MVLFLRSPLNLVHNTNNIMNLYAVFTGSLRTDFNINTDMVIGSYPQNGFAIVLAEDEEEAQNIIAARVIAEEVESYTPGTLTAIPLNQSGTVAFWPGS